MKILSLRFENINSLKGHWHIDFEKSPFDDNALFAITGPTGAGKTTILRSVVSLIQPDQGAVFFNGKEEYS